MVSGRNVKINDTFNNLPNLRNPITKWFSKIDFIRVTKTISNFIVTETEEDDSFFGVVQNFDSRQLKILPEAQRAWTWKMIHATPDLQIDVDEKIRYRGVEYRCMNIRDFREYGYLEYHIVADYED